MKREAYLVKRRYVRSRYLLPVPIVCMVSFLASHTLAQASLTSPQDVRVFDTPNDGGESLTVQWAPMPWDGPDIRYQVLVGDASTTDPQKLTVVSEFSSNSKYVKDVKTAWWTRTVEKTWHQAMVKSAKGLEIKDDQPYAVAVATIQADQRLFSVDDDETNELECAPSRYARFAAINGNVPPMMELYDAWVAKIDGSHAAPAIGQALPTFADGLATQRVLAAVGFGA